MAKKNQNTSKKKVAGDNSEGDSILEEINTKLKSGQKDLQKQVDDLTTQVKILSKDPGKTARKFLKAIEKSYHEQVAKLQKDFDKRMVAVHKLQDRVIAHLPTELAEKLHLKDSNDNKSIKKPSKAASKAAPKTAAKAAPKTAAKAAPKTATKAAPKTATKAAPKTAAKAAPKTATKAAPKPTKKAAPKPAAKTATKPAAKTATKPAAKTATKPAAKAATKPAAKKTTKVTAKKPSIASINGIGPVTYKKLVEAGFTSLEDLANTPASKTEALKQFEKTKGFNTWKKEAQTLLNKK